ncbi:hypothetical protein DY000_02021506 [Brassica cretica]|uniref:Uncharacterized protein n=1 Tax=Brassica cretica TaxID=69181 RepID=A0ABQ7ECN1_BRACR|nr:hypothetical protein DY000_02021506 [Brassica cretica]
MGDEKGSVKRRRGFGRPPTSEDGNASSSGFIFINRMSALELGIFFENHQSSRLCRLQDTVRSPELLHRRQDISGSRKIVPDPVCYQGTGPPTGSECGSGLRGTRDSRITGAMSCLGKACRG